MFFRRLQPVYCIPVNGSRIVLRSLNSGRSSAVGAGSQRASMLGMRRVARHCCVLGGLTLLGSVSLWAQAHDERGDAPSKVSWVARLGNQDTFGAARLTGSEQEQIIDQVQRTSFDIPDDWQSELQVRRVSLGASDGLVIRGTRLLCGGTGNCQTWVFRLSHGAWWNLFENEAPIVSAVGFEQATTLTIENLVSTVHMSAQEELWILFKFDGRYYRQDHCYNVSFKSPGAQDLIKVACK